MAAVFKFFTEIGMDFAGLIRPSGASILFLVGKRPQTKMVFILGKLHLVLKWELD